MNQAASVLIVDDDVCTRLVIEATLSRLGYRTRCAGDGLAALEAMDAEAADLVITDMLMPRMNGLELIEALQARPDAPKVIAMSGGGVLSGMEALEAARDLGADAVLEKPLSMSTVAKTVAGLIDVQTSERDRRGWPWGRTAA